MIDHISDYLLCPTKRQVDTLEAERVNGNVGICGNVMIDTCFEQLPIKGNENGDYMLLTLHRAETVDDKEALEEVFDALGEVKHNIIFPCHPRTKKQLEKFKVKVPKNVKLIEPVSYKEMVGLIANAKKVLTDSGGVQVEAHFLATPCYTLRNETEWQETVESGWNTLVGTDKDTILKYLNAKFTGGNRDFVYGK